MKRKSGLIEDPRCELFPSILVGDTVRTSSTDVNEKAGLNKMIHWLNNLRFALNIIREIAGE